MALKIYFQINSSNKACMWELWTHKVAKFITWQIKKSRLHVESPRIFCHFDAAPLPIIKYIIGNEMVVPLQVQVVVCFVSLACLWFIPCIILVPICINCILSHKLISPSIHAYEYILVPSPTPLNKLRGASLVLLECFPFFPF